MSDEIADKLMRARCRLMTREPWYGHISMSMVWMPSQMAWLPEVRRTMGVRIVNGGEVQCLYYPNFVDKLEIRELFGVIQHEIEHIVRVHCVRIGARDPQAYNIACCKPNELIVGGGNKPIDELAAGDLVYGRDGREVEVVVPMRRHHNGKMIRLKGRFLLPFSVTPEHPVLVVPWKLKTISRPKTTIKEYGEPIFIEARKLTGCGTTRQAGPARSGFALVVPKYKQVDNTRWLDLSEYIIRQGDGSIRTDGLHLNRDMAWLMGLYVAEGSACSADFSAGMQWSLAADEVELAAEVQRILGEYGFSPRIDVDGSSMRLQVCSPILARAFADWFGRGAARKQLPFWIRHHQDRDLVMAFMAGYFAGDGHNSESANGVRNSASTVSRLLALQLQTLGFTHGIPFGLYESNRGIRTLNAVSLPAEKIFVLESGTWQARELFGQTPGRQRNHHFDTSNHVYVPLLEITEEDYDGPVCNVETTDHTYLVSNAVVHNCDMTVNGLKNDPRVGYKEPDTGNRILPMKGNIVWIPEDWPHDQSSEAYYNMLLKRPAVPCCNKCGRPMVGNKGSGKAKPECAGSTECSECGQDDDGTYTYGDLYGQAIDDHSIWQTTDVSEDEARQIVKNLVDQANAKSQGQFPGHLAGAIAALGKPIVRWRELLRHFIGQHVGNRRLTHSRRNRRHDHFGLPGVSHHAAATCNVIVDTSGSVGQKELEQFFGEIDAIASRTKVRILQWDHGFQGFKAYRTGDWRKFQIHGRGGTDMAAPIDWLMVNHQVADVQIMLTDGICNWHDECKFPMITVITGKDTQGPGWGHEVRLQMYD